MLQVWRRSNIAGLVSAGRDQPAISRSINSGDDLFFKKSYLQPLLKYIIIVKFFLKKNKIEKNGF